MTGQFKLCWADQVEFEFWFCFGAAKFKKPWNRFWQILVNTVVTKNFNLAYSFISPISKHFVFKDISKLNSFRYQKVIQIASTRRTTTQTVWLRRRHKVAKIKRKGKCCSHFFPFFLPHQMERGENDAIGERGRERDRFVFALTPPPFYSRNIFPFFFCENGRRRRLVSRRPISTPLPSRNLCWLMQPLHDLVRGGWKEGEFLQELLLGE